MDTWMRGDVLVVLYRAELAVPVHRIVRGRTARRRDGCMASADVLILAQLGVGTHWRDHWRDLQKPSPLVSSRVQSMVPVEHEEPDGSRGRGAPKPASGSGTDRETQPPR